MDRNTNIPIVVEIAEVDSDFDPTIMLMAGSLKAITKKVRRSFVSRGYSVTKKATIAGHRALRVTHSDRRDAYIMLSRKDVVYNVDAEIDTWILA